MLSTGLVDNRPRPAKHVGSNSSTLEITLVTTNLLVGPKTLQFCEALVFHTVNKRLLITKNYNVR